VPELIAKGPWDGQAAVTRAGLRLEPLNLGQVTSVALFAGGAKAAAKALKPLGLAFPAPGEWVAKGDARLIWTGHEQAFLQGAAPPEGLSDHAAVTDQSDGWAGVLLGGEGAAIASALARLVPVDLRPGAVPAGRVMRAPVNHMSAILLRRTEGVEVWVFRSMARTLWHELTEVLERLEARGPGR
jgi:sarcosine oxidase subunit gamma